MFTGFLAGTFFRKIPLNVLGAKNFHAKEREYIEVNYTIAYQACHYFLGLPDGQIKYLQVLIAVTESVCLT